MGSLGKSQSKIENKKIEPARLKTQQGDLGKSQGEKKRLIRSKTRKGDLG